MRIKRGLAPPQSIANDSDQTWIGQSSHELLGERVGDRQFVMALGRGLEILRCFSQGRPELTVSDIATLSGMAQPTAWRLCYTLQSLGYLVPVPRSSRLAVGAGILALGHAALPTAEVEEAVRPRLQKVADRFGAAVGIGERDRLSMIYVMRCRARPYLAASELRVGTRAPIHVTALGWAYLAALDEPGRERLMKQIHAARPASWSGIREHILQAVQQLKTQGFVVNQGVYKPQLHTVAVPLQLHQGKLLALNCTAPAGLLSPGKLRSAVGPALLKLSEDLKRMLPSGA